MAPYRPFCFRIPSSPPPSTLFPYATLFRSRRQRDERARVARPARLHRQAAQVDVVASQDDLLGRAAPDGGRPARRRRRSEEHTSELQSRENLVCRLLLEKKKTTSQPTL